MKTTITIESYEIKQTKTNKPMRKYKTDIGVINCFDEKLFDKFDDNLGVPLLVEYEENGNFKNLVKFIKIEETPTEKVEKKKSEVPTAMKLSYVKDTFATLTAYTASKDMDIKLDVLWDMAIHFIQKAEEDLR